MLDVGNTNIVLGVYHHDQLKYHWRMETSRQKTEDEFGMAIKGLFQHVGLALRTSMELLSPLLYLLSCLLWKKCVIKYFQEKPLIVGPGIKTGLNIKYENPREVGADRIVNAVAGINDYGSP